LWRHFLRIVEKMPFNRPENLCTPVTGNGTDPKGPGGDTNAIFIFQLLFEKNYICATTEKRIL
jgi:hypothetical protein